MQAEKQPYHSLQKSIQISKMNKPIFLKLEQ